MESRRAHVLRNQERAQRGEYTGTFLTIEPDAWRAEFVRAPRAGRRLLRRPRRHLLTMRITEGDGFELLCPFLGVAAPDEPFPGGTAGASG